jgi:hypothetical protein
MPGYGEGTGTRRLPPIRLQAFPLQNPPRRPTLPLCPATGESPWDRHDRVSRAPSSTGPPGEGRPFAAAPRRGSLHVHHHMG